jgi:HSP20 family protein
MTLVRWQPKRDLALDPLRGFDRDMDRFFGWALGNRLGDLGNGSWAPALDLVEKDDHFEAMMDLPGLSKDDVELTVTNNQLFIRGERKHESEKKGEGYYHCERVHGRFERTISLPSDIDAEKVEATFKNGVLEVRIPKTEKAKSRQISIKN